MAELGRELRPQKGHWRTINGRPQWFPDTHANKWVRTQDGERNVFQMLDELLTGRSRRQGKMAATVNPRARRSHVASKVGMTAAGAGGTALVVAGVGLVALPVALLGAAAAAGVAGYRASAANAQEIENHKGVRAERGQKAKHFLGLMAAGASEYGQARRSQKQAEPVISAEAKPTLRQRAGASVRRSLRQSMYDALPASVVKWQGKRWQGDLKRWEHKTEDHAIAGEHLMAEQEELMHKQQQLEAEIARSDGAPDLALQQRADDHAEEMMTWLTDLEMWAEREQSLNNEHDRLADKGQLLANTGLKKIGKLSTENVSWPQRLRAADQDLLLRTQRALRGQQGKPNSAFNQARRTLRTEPLRNGEVPDKVGGSVTGVIDTLWDTLFDGWPRWSPRSF